MGRTNWRKTRDNQQRGNLKMAKNKKRKSKQTEANYEVGYGKPPKEYQWKKGCPSPNPKGRPKKPQSIREAIQLTLNKEINVKNENGDFKKISGAEALVNRALADAIAKDGATRRMFFNKEFLNLTIKEQEYEYTPEEKELIEVENTYGELLHQFAEMGPKFREIFQRIMSEALRDILNERCYEENM